MVLPCLSEVISTYTEVLSQMSFISDVYLEFNLLHPGAAFLYPLKISENLKVF